MKTKKFYSDQQAFNTELAEKINSYWKEQGVCANARCEKIKVPITINWINTAMKNKKAKWVPIERAIPKIVESWEIVSDIQLGPA